MDEQVLSLWSRYRAAHPTAPEHPAISFHFCDNHEDAQTCLQLVLQGKKRATASSLAELELSKIPVPKAGDLSVITDFDGKAHAIIETTSVEIKRFGDVDERFAYDEGEGDLSLNWWRDAHRAYYQRVLADTSVKVDDDLMVVCERFALVMTA